MPYKTVSLKSYETDVEIKTSKVSFILMIFIMKEIAYNNLCEFILFVMKDCPSMYLQMATISNLEIFITGYMVSNSKDIYFDSSVGFFQWFCRKKKINEVNFSTWTYPFLEEASGDEFMALQLYFTYLQEYYDTKI